MYLGDHKGREKKREREENEEERGESGRRQSQFLSILQFLWMNGLLRDEWNSSSPIWWHAPSAAETTLHSQHLISMVLELKKL